MKYCKGTKEYTLDGVFELPPVQLKFLLDEWVNVAFVNCRNFRSGAENKQGYIWERHYRCVTGILPHNDVVSCVTFNPVDQEMAISTSDDHAVKVWRSRNQMRRLRKIYSQEPTAPELFEPTGSGTENAGPSCSKLGDYQSSSATANADATHSNHKNFTQSAHATYAFARKQALLEFTESSESEIFSD